MTNTALPKIGFIGVGRMGGQMALNTHKAGFAVTAFDVFPAALAPLTSAGIASAASRVEIASIADIIILMLPSDDALKETMEGDDNLLSVLLEGQIVVDMSTSKLATSRYYAQRYPRNGRTCSARR